jgi:hypothetical protein
MEVMKCRLCGRGSRAADFEQQRMVTGGEVIEGGGSIDKATYWICRDCANYRRGTIRLVYWLAGVLAVIALIAVVATVITSPR